MPRRKRRSREEVVADVLAQCKAKQAEYLAHANEDLAKMAAYSRENGLTVVASTVSAGMDRTCDVCKNSETERYPIQVAAAGDILPHKDCTCVFWRGKPYPEIVGYCTCSWVTEVSVE